jgi:hypothetical protein
MEFSKEVVALRDGKTFQSFIGTLFLRMDSPGRDHISSAFDKVAKEAGNHLLELLSIECMVMPTYVNYKLETVGMPMIHVLTTHHKFNRILFKALNELYAINPLHPARALDIMNDHGGSIRTHSFIQQLFITLLNLSTDDAKDMIRQILNFTYSCTNDKTPFLSILSSVELWSRMREFFDEMSTIVLLKHLSIKFKNLLPLHWNLHHLHEHDYYTRDQNQALFMDIADYLYNRISVYESDSEEVLTFQQILCMQDYRGSTLLHYAVYDSNVEIVIKLLQISPSKGTMESELRDSRGDTYLDIIRPDDECPEVAEMIRVLGKVDPYQFTKAANST